jgi:hypothetical protein
MTVKCFAGGGVIMKNNTEAGNIRLQMETEFNQMEAIKFE